MDKFLRRFGIIRYCLLQYTLDVRKKQIAARWASTDRVLSLIGQITLTWSSIEMMIDRLIGWYHPMKGAATIQPNIPRDFSRKMDYLNKMARDPKFPENGDGIRAIRTECKRLNKWRIALVHGIADSVNPSRTEWVMQTMTIKDGKHVRESYKFTISDLNIILSQMSEFLSVTAPIVAKGIGLPARATAKSSSAKSE